MTRRPFGAAASRALALSLGCLLLAGCEQSQAAAPGAPHAPVEPGWRSDRVPIEHVPEPGIDTVPRGTPELADLERLWSAQRYGEVLPLLISYRRAAPYGRNEVVDYMIATSACRVVGREDLGRQMFRWLLGHYNLNPESRRMAQAELDRCPPAVRLVPVSLTHVGVGPASTSGTRGKMFYMLSRGEEVPMANEPVKVFRAIPQEELEARRLPPARAAEAAARAAARAGPGYRAVAEGGFVVASRTHSEEQMRAIARGLERYLSFFVAAYGMTRPPHLVTTYLTPDAKELSKIAKQVHGIGVSGMSIGYSFRDDLSMVGIIPREVYGTLAHELFHLMVRRDFGDVPPWLDEGMAALYEVSRVRGDGSIRGIPNWRGPVLRELWGMRPSIAEVVRADWRAFEAEGAGEPVRQAANHAMARYLVLFLQERGKLPAVFEAFRARRRGRRCSPRGRPGPHAGGRGGHIGHRAGPGVRHLVPGSASLIREGGARRPRCRTLRPSKNPGGTSLTTYGPGSRVWPMPPPSRPACGWDVSATAPPWSRRHPWGDGATPLARREQCCWGHRT